jgi:hypothetical protein
MLSAFLNPWTFAAGAALVSAPIVIHLINRIRFRRVKWAAMEFLLKAQKKMRRKKILEQLLLLLLRCLLVFLIGVLFARFIGCDTGKGKESRPTTHLVILDDSPSMAEGWRREDGEATTAFDEAKRLVHERIMPAAAEATTAQTLHVLRLSELDSPYPSGTKTIDGNTLPRTPEEVRDEARVNGANIARFEGDAKAWRVSTVRRSLVDGLRKGKELLAARAAADTAQVLHVVSDLRSADWAADGPAIGDLLKEYKEGGVAVHLIDVANPARKPDRKSPPFPDNVAIVELKPRNRVVSANQQGEIEVRVKNYGATDLKDVGVSFYLNGQGRVIQSAQIPTLPANQEKAITVPVMFTQTGTKDKPLERFNLVTAALSLQGGALTSDDVRHAVIEVRDAVQVLVVDGRTVEAGTDLRQRPEGDSFYLRTLLLETKAQELGKIRVDTREAKDLDAIDLRPYSAVYLMNVPALSDKAIARVEKYAREGGGVGVFLGPNVKPEEYTQKMHRGGAGFFPVPLQNEPSKELTPDQQLARQLAFGKRVLLREGGNKQHPALARIYTNERGELLKDDGVERFFFFANIDTHWPVGRRGPWRDDKDTQELYCMPNEASIAAFEERADNLVSEVKKRYGEAKFEPARKYLDPLLQRVRETPKQTNPSLPLSVLARYLDQLLCDQINDGDESEPVLREFWAAPEMGETRKLAQELRDEAKYGDPLYVVKRFGSGRVAVMTTDAGGTHAGKKQWTDWPSGKGGAGWVVVVGEMHKYLSGGGDDANRAVGSPFATEFDFERYEPTVAVNFLSADPPKAKGGDANLDDNLQLVREAITDKLVMDAPKAADPNGPKPPYRLTYPGARRPGAYLFTLTRKKAAAEAQPAAGGAVVPDPLGDQDYVGVSFNLDALAEGDLRRANTDDLASQTNKTPLHNTADLSWVDEFKQKPSDLSSGRWLYLVILLVLIAEQAWAVRVSYHAKPDDLAALAPSAAAVYHTTGAAVEATPEESRV